MTTTKQILLVEADGGRRALLRVILARPDFAIHEATAPAVALAQARATPPDLVILSLHPTPVRPTGLELCRALKADPGTARVAVLLLAASSQAVEQAAAQAAGADAYFARPFEPVLLRAAVEHVLHRAAHPVPRHPPTPAHRAWPWALLAVAPPTAPDPNRVAYLAEQGAGWYLRLVSSLPAGRAGEDLVAGPFATAAEAVEQGRAWCKDTEPRLPQVGTCPACRAVIEADAMCSGCGALIPVALRRPAVPPTPPSPHYATD